MHYFNTKKNFFIFIIFSILVAITSSMALAASPLKNEDTLPGKWVGVVTDKDSGDVKIDLTISRDMKNENLYTYSLHYGVPRSCRLETEELSIDNNVIIVKFTGASDLKFCMVRLKENGKMTINIDGDDKLSVNIESNSGFKESAVLKKR